MRLPPSVRVDSIKAIAPGFLSDYEEIVTFDVSGFVRGMEVSINPNASIQVALDEPSSPSGVRD